MCEKGGKIMAENITFVTIDLNRKQVNTDNPVHNDKTGKDYARVFAPGNGTFLYPLNTGYSEGVKSVKCMRLYQDHNLNRWKFEDGYILETQIHKNGI